jgi:hypothetical protein
MSEIKITSPNEDCSLPSSVSQDVLAVNEEKSVPTKKKRSRGRPKKEEVQKYIKREKRGRPPGEAARIKEFTASLLLTHSNAIIRKIVHKALDDNDKDQIAALKMCMDRMLPVSYFEDKGQSSGAKAITINITGVQQESPMEMIQHEPVDVETTLIDYEEEDGSTS